MLKINQNELPKAAWKDGKQADNPKLLTRLIFERSMI